MAKLLKLRRGTTSQHSSFTGAEGEVTVDTTKDTIVVHDGSTAGGVPLAKESDNLSLIDEDNMSTNSDTRPPSQQSVKAYVDGKVPTTITVADESSDTTCFPVFVTAATGDLAPKTGSNITFNSSTGLLTAVGLTLSGNLTVNGTTTTVATTNTTVTDNLLELNSGATSNANDAGILIERGSTGDNAIIAWDESEDKFTVGTTTATNDATGNISITTGTIVANVEGNVTGNVTGNTSGSAGSCTGNAATATTATNVTVADESSDTSCNVLFTTAATGDLAPKSGTNLTFNSSTGELEADILKDDKGNVRAIPQNNQGSSYTLVAADAGKCITSAGGVTVNQSIFASGDAVTIVNDSGSNITITQGSNVTIYNASDATTGNRTLASRGMASMWFSAHNYAYISGAGLS